MPPWPKAVEVDLVCGAVTCRKVGDRVGAAIGVNTIIVGAAY